MRFVREAKIVPHHCIFYPQIGSTHELGFIEADGELDSYFKPYVSVAALRDLAEKIPEAQLARRSEVDALKQELDEAYRNIEDLTNQLKQADKELDAVQVLKHRTEQNRAKPVGASSR